MKQISGRAKKLIENLLGWSTAPHEGEWEYDELGRCIGGFAYADMAQSELEDYIADLEAENRALRHSLELRECEEMEHKPDPLGCVPYVSLSNEEIAAMTPEHPLYKLKLVKGKEERNEREHNHA